MCAARLALWWAIFRLSSTSGTLWPSIRKDFNRAELLQRHLHFSQHNTPPHAINYTFCRSKHPCHLLTLKCLLRRCARFSLLPSLHVCHRPILNQSSFFVQMGIIKRIQVETAPPRGYGGRREYDRYDRGDRGYDRYDRGHDRGGYDRYDRGYGRSRDRGECMIYAHAVFSCDTSHGTFKWSHASIPSDENSQHESLQELKENKVRISDVVSCSQRPLIQHILQIATIADDFIRRSTKALHQ